MLNRFFGKFSKDMGIDLGTAYTRIYVQDRGIVINEPSIVAINTKTDQILAIGRDAQKMLGKTPPHIVTVRPLVDGVISDFEVTEKMLRYFTERVHQESFTILPRPRVVISISQDTTEVERKAVEDAVTSAGAREVFLVEKAMATAIGARLPIREAHGTMIIDLGDGTTEISIISLSGIVTWKSLRIAGDELNKNIIQYARDHFNILLGERVAELIKNKIGSACEINKPLEMKMRGRDLLSGLPKEISINDANVREAIRRSIRIITDDIKSILEIIPPELSADIHERGIVLTGGGARLKGLDMVISREAHIPARVADDPATCVARGTGIILDSLDDYREILITSAQEDKALR